MDESINIPGYTLKNEIGSGAMATVYLAVQDALERKVAMKLMSSHLLSDESQQKRFLKEGKIIAQLNHSNIVTIYDIGVIDSTYYMAMEYVDGGLTLSEKIRSRGSGLPPAQVRAIMIQVASALGYAHQRSFVHRDVKPANILFRENGTAVLSDFGIAKAVDDGTAITKQGWAIGTPSYMSPEQALGKTVDARCDLYALGVVCYEMLTGEKPYQADDSFAVALKHVNDPIPVLPDAFKAFQPVLERLMAKDPEHRFATAEDVISALQSVQLVDTLGATVTIAPSHVNQLKRSSPNTGTEPAPDPIRPGDTATHIDQDPVNAGVSVRSESTLDVTTSSANKLGKRLGVAAMAILLLGGAIWGYQAWRSAPEPCTLDVPLIDRQKLQLKDLLDTAALNVEFGRYVLPPVSNATFGLQEALKIDRCNEPAKQMLVDMPQLILQQVRDQHAEGNKETSVAILQAALEFFPEHEELLKLQQDVDDN